MTNRNRYFLILLAILALAVFIFGVKARPYWQAIKPAVFSGGDQNQELGTLVVHEDFILSLFSDQVENPRVIIEEAEGSILVSEPALGRVSLVDESGVRSTVLENLNRPHGLALQLNNLYIAETNQVSLYNYEDGSASDPETLFDLPDGGRHWTRTLGLGPDGNLYISIGSSCNICLEDEWERDKILQYNLQTKALTEYATGLRNSVFFAWHPRTGQMYATEMGRDWLGDGLPPDELNLITEGSDYGFPYCFGDNIVDPEFEDASKCIDAKPAFTEFKAHESPLGIDFYEGDAIVALHGSWNAKIPVGYEVIRLSQSSDYQQRETLLAGFLQDDGSSIGRPAGVLVTSDDRILVSDDRGNKIYLLQRR
jgi:glucose/arabinose dehydrogenase